MYLFDTHVHTSEVSFCGKVAGADFAAAVEKRGGVV